MTAPGVSQPSNPCATWCVSGTVVSGYCCPIGTTYANGTCYYCNQSGSTPYYYSGSCNACPSEQNVTNDGKTCCANGLKAATSGASGWQSRCCQSGAPGTVLVSDGTGPGTGCCASSSYYFNGSSCVTCSGSAPSGNTPGTPHVWSNGACSCDTGGTEVIVNGGANCCSYTYPTYTNGKCCQSGYTWSGSACVAPGCTNSSIDSGATGTTAVNATYAKHFYYQTGLYAVDNCGYYQYTCTSSGWSSKTVIANSSDACCNLLP